MNRSRILTYVKIAILSIVVQLVAIVAGIVSAGAGHGSYLAVKLFFPYTMLSAGLDGSMMMPFIWLAAIQYLLYGFAWAMAITYKKVGPVIFVLASTHACAVLLAFLLFDGPVARFR
jgi:hypothetical protein